MEQVQGQEVNRVEVFENDIEFYLAKFCEENNIENLKTESQSVWNSCLRYIYKSAFKGKELKSSVRITDHNPIASNYNMYNYDLVNSILDIYIYDLCMRYDKEVSILGFSTLTGIPDSTIYDWSSEGRKLSAAGSEIFKKLQKYREESLSNKLASGKGNPVGVIAILNRRFGWASPYTSDANKDRKTLTSEDVRALLSERGGQIEQKDNM